MSYQHSSVFFHFIEILFDKHYDNVEILTVMSDLIDVKSVGVPAKVLLYGGNFLKM